MFKQTRNWCFTDFELLDYKEIYEKGIGCIRYICVGNEICPKTKKKHCQGWIQFENKKTMGGVKRVFKSKKIHLEQCIAGAEANDKYCKKEGEFKIYGKYKTQGMRSDLEDIKHRLDKGEKLEGIADDYFGDYLRYHKGLEKYKEMVDKRLSKKFRKVDVEVYCGLTGTGKTRDAMEKNEDTYKICASALKWWDGYNGEKHLVIDEYNNDVNITKMLNILDGYQLRLAVKGGHTYARWTSVTITSNIIPSEWHPCAKDVHRDALMRRINKVYKFVAKVY